MENTPHGVSFLHTTSCCLSFGRREYGVQWIIPLMLLILLCLTQVLIRGWIHFRREGMMWNNPRTLRTHYTFQLGPSQGPKRRPWKKNWMDWLCKFQPAKLGDLLEHQEEALIHLIHVQKGPSSSLFEPRSFDNKTANFVSVSANLILWCFHVFCGVLTNIGIPIMCGNIDYFL
jgi:hypothetical protein